MIDAITAQWIKGPLDEAAVAEGCRFDLAKADRVRKFFSSFLRHSKGEWAGKPFELLDWQWHELIAPLFGWIRPDGTRRFRKSYIELPKKNGKSTIASGIGLYLLCGDGEQGAEVYSAAADRDQASIVHGEAVRMVRSSEALSSYLSVHETTKAINFKKTNGIYKALSSEAAGKEGLNANGVVIDELHIWRGRALWDALKYAGRSRRQPLFFVITTAGDDLLSVCWEQHQYAMQVMSGDVKDTRFFALIKAANPEDDWTAPATWKKANPSFGSTIKAEDFAADVWEAEKTPTAQASFKRYSLNIWASGTNPWLKIEDWLACRADFTEDDLAGHECYAGLDLAKTRDTTALVLVFPILGLPNPRYRILSYFWLPEDAVSDPDRPEEFRVWAKNGYLETTPGNVCDYSFVKKRIGQLADKFSIQEMAFDPYNAEQLTQECETELGIKRIAFGQTITNFAEPTKEFERLILSKDIEHNGHPVLSWQAGNVAVRCDVNNNLRPVKPPQGDHRKIDGIVAAIMGLARARLTLASSELDIFVL